MRIMSTVITPAEFAELVESDGRTVRKFLRSITPREDQPGKGSRWQLDGTKRSVNKLQKQFAEWTAAQAQAALERAEKAKAEADAQVDEIDDETLDD